MILLDSNVLVYALSEASPNHLTCAAVVERAMGGHLPAVLVPQVLLESYSVVTSRRVDRPLTAARALLALGEIRDALPVMDVRVEALWELDRLIRLSRRVGAAVFDLFLVAQMNVNGIREICTENARDFRVGGVVAVSPAALLAR